MSGPSMCTNQTCNDSENDNMGSNPADTSNFLYVSAGYDVQHNAASNAAYGHETADGVMAPDDDRAL